MAAKQLDGRVPEIRIHNTHRNPPHDGGDFVLYWMIAQRRLTYNFALQRAVEWAVDLRKPLLIFEPLRCGYRWASDRIHRFAMQGMRDHATALKGSPVGYFPYVETEHRGGEGLFEALAEHAAVIVTDEYPCFFIPQLVGMMESRVQQTFERVDGNGLLPMKAAGQAYPTAYAFRRFLQNELPKHLTQFPAARPLDDVKLVKFSDLPKRVSKRWPAATLEFLAAEPANLKSLPIDHLVGPAAMPGGSEAAQATVDRFIHEKLDRYTEDRNEPSLDGGSGLSPYLHFGHIGVHDVFQRLAEREKWHAEKFNPPKAGGKREGWWKMSVAAEGFLDELVTWREVGFNMCSQRRDYDRYESLPDWAQATLEKHSKDRRDELYSLEQLESATTSDALWNAAQRQLNREGRMHNYLRMLWGKKILQWSLSPREALRRLIHLNNKYAVDGRDPNSYSGIFWCLGRYDRAWGPERPIFGTIRYMSSDNTAKKFNVKPYLARYGDQPTLW